MPDSRPNYLHDLIGRIAQGDRHAFDALYEATSARVNAACLSVLKDRREAEETLEQVYIYVWRHAAREADSGLSPLAWLMTTARDHAMERRHGSPAGAAADVAPLLDDPVLAVRHVYLDGLGLAEFARLTGLPVETAHQHLHAGLAAMGAEFDSAEDGLAAEVALGLRDGPGHERVSDPAFTARLRHWRERLAGLANDLTPVMAPARARQRIRESLGHGRAPLSVDPSHRRPWWRRNAVLLSVLALAGALIWYMGRA